jgi:hypothetical protein
MDEPAAMCHIEGIPELLGDGRHPRGIDASLRRDQTTEVGPIDVPHREEQHAVGLIGVVDRHDVWVVDRGGDFGFPQESVPELLVVRQLGREQFEGDHPTEAQVPCQVDGTHPSPADDLLDAVPGDLGPDPGVLGHAPRL